MRIWVLTGKTESGDEVAVVFDKEPTEDQADAYLYSNGWEDEYKEIGFICWSVEEMEVRKVDSISDAAIAALKENRIE